LSSRPGALVYIDPSKCISSACMPLAIRTSVFKILSAVDLIADTTVRSWQILTEKTLGSSCEGSRGSDLAVVTHMENTAHISDAYRAVRLMKRKHERTLPTSTDRAPNSHFISRLVKNGLVISVNEGGFSSESSTVINSFDTSNNAKGLGLSRTGTTRAARPGTNRRRVPTNAIGLGQWHDKHHSSDRQ
jgi:hypothetical protein